MSEPTAAAVVDSTQAIELARPTQDEIAAISGVHTLANVPDENGMVKTVMITHPGTNKAIVSTDLVEALAWLGHELTGKDLARYEVTLMPMSFADYSAMPDETRYPTAVGVKLARPSDF